MSLTLRPSASAMRPHVLGRASGGCPPCRRRPDRRTASRGTCRARGPGRPLSDAARTVIASAWPWATRFVPSSGSTAMSIAGTSSARRRVRPTALADVEHRRLVALALADDDRARRSRSRPSSCAWPRWRPGPRSSLSPRPMNRARRDRGRLGHADHLEREQLFHWPPDVGDRRWTWPSPQWRKWRRPVKTIARWCRSATSMAISSRIEPPGWMIAVTPAWAADLDAVREREVRIRRHDRGPRPVARAPQRDLDRDLAAGLAGADADRRRVAGEHDRVRADVADRAPGEQQVGQLLERRPALGDDLQLAAVEPELVEASRPAGRRRCA